MIKQVTYGMVGGDLKALIGECHRKALGLDPRAKLVSGCFSIDDDLNDECAEAYHVDKSRVYYDTEEMAKKKREKLTLWSSAPLIFYIIRWRRCLWKMASTWFVKSR